MIQKIWKNKKLRKKADKFAKPLDKGRGLLYNTRPRTLGDDLKCKESKFQVY
jgi:hypothetical protein